MKVPVIATGAVGDGGERETSKLLGKLVTLCEVLFTPTWDGETAKGEVALMVFRGNPFTRVLLKIENPPLKMSVQGRTLDDAFAGLELALKSDHPPWESDGGSKGKGAKKK